jgi:hypothetical protein
MLQIPLKVVLQKKVGAGKLKMGFKRRGSKHVNSIELAQVDI